MDEFEQWVTILLLAAMQRAGYFKAVGESVTAAALKQKVNKSYVRFIDEALNALCHAGELLCCAATQHPCMYAGACMSHDGLHVFAQACTFAPWHE